MHCEMFCCASRLPPDSEFVGSFGASRNEATTSWAAFCSLFASLTSSSGLHADDIVWRRFVSGKAIRKMGLCLSFGFNKSMSNIIYPLLLP